MVDELAPPTSQPWVALIRFVEEGRRDELEMFVDSLTAIDKAFAIAHLDDEQIALVIRSLRAEPAAELVRHLSEAQAGGVLAALRPEEAAAILAELETDEQADLIQELAEHQADAILDEMPSDEASKVRELAAYADDVAGGLMTRNFIAVPVNSTIREVISLIEDALEEMEDSDARYAYVVDPQQRLVGVLPMQNLLFVRRAKVVREAMVTNPLTVRDDAPLEELSDVFDSHNFLGVPVIDQEGKLRGVVQRDSVYYAENRAAEKDYLKSQGIIGGEELRTMPVWTRARRRLSWLSVNIFLNLGAASVIAAYQETLQAVIALAVFLPIISDMSGCSGNQAVAVSMRELSLGLIRSGEVLRVWLQEFMVGLINGAILGLLIAVVSLFYDGNPYLGMVVGVALFFNTLVAVSIGGTVPLLVKRLGFDPAIASGPLLTTITDMCGFFFVLGIASRLLDKLTHVG